MLEDKTFDFDYDKTEVDLDYDELTRFVSPKSSYIQLDSLQNSGVYIDSDIQHMHGLEIVF